MFRSWAVTVRPLHGVNQLHINSYMRWAAKADYSFIATEKEGDERHIHSALYFKKPCNKSQLGTRILSIPCFADLSKDEKSVLRQGIKILYNNDFVDNYICDNPEKLESGDDCTILQDNLPGDTNDLLEYYPPPGDKSAVRPPGDPWLLKMEALWKEHGPQNPEYISEGDVSAFFNSMMFEKRLIRATIKGCRNKVRTFLWFLIRFNEPGYVDDPDPPSHTIIYKNPDFVINNDILIPPPIVRQENVKILDGYLDCPSSETSDNLSSTKNKI